MTQVAIKELVARIMGTVPLSISRQTFGHNSIVFDVTLPERNVIVRTNSNSQVFASTLHNLKVLAGLQLPVPTVLTADLTQIHFPFAYMILDKIPGRDLRYQLSSMTLQQMTTLAEQIIMFQRRVMTLPPGSGFGYIGIGEKAAFSSWWDVVQPTSNKEKIAHNSETSAKWELRVQEAVRTFEPYFRSISSTCFLDDVTVKNVIMKDGEMQGLIDFDCVCYGDPLYWIALTETGIVSDVGTQGLFYAEELKRLWNVTPEQAQILALCSASMALDFIRRSDAAETPDWRLKMFEAVERSMEIAEK